MEWGRTQCPSVKRVSRGLILAALVGFVQQGCELQQELKSTVNILSEVLKRARNSYLGSMASRSPQPEVQVHKDTVLHKRERVLAPPLPPVTR